MRSTPLVGARWTTDLPGVAGYECAGELRAPKMYLPIRLMETNGFLDHYAQNINRIRPTRLFLFRIKGLV